MTGSQHRRGFLLGALGVVTGAAATRHALALSAEPIDVSTQRLLSTACHDRALHPRLLAEIAEKLGEITPEQRQRIVAAAACPFCGCDLSTPEE